MKAIRIISSIFSFLCGLAFFAYIVYLFTAVKSVLIYVCFPFAILGVASFSAGLISLTKKPRIGSLLLPVFIFLLIAEIFNLLLCFVGAIGFLASFLPDISWNYINLGAASTGFIMSFCILGIIFSGIAKKGKLIPSIVAMVFFFIVEGLIIGLNPWFNMEGGFMYYAAAILSMVPFINIVFFKNTKEHVQKIIEKAKVQLTNTQNQTSNVVEAPKNKVRVWTENGFTYTNRP